MKRFKRLLDYPCIPENINLIDKRLFGGFLPLTWVITNPAIPLPSPNSV